MIDCHELNNSFATVHDHLETSEGRMTLIAEGELSGIEGSRYFFEEMTEVLDGLCKALSATTAATGKLAGICEQALVLASRMRELSEEAAYDSNCAQLLNDVDVAREFYTMMMEMKEKLEEGAALTGDDSVEAASMQLLACHDALEKSAEDIEKGAVSAEQLPELCGERRQGLSIAKEQLSEAGVDMEAYEELFKKVDEALQNAGEDGNPVFIREAVEKLEEILAGIGAAG